MIDEDHPSIPILSSRVTRIPLETPWGKYTRGLVLPIERLRSKFLTSHAEMAANSVTTYT